LYVKPALEEASFDWDVWTASKLRVRVGVGIDQDCNVALCPVKIPQAIVPSIRSILNGRKHRGMLCCTVAASCCDWRWTSMRLEWPNALDVTTDQLEHTVSSFLASNIQVLEVFVALDSGLQPEVIRVVRFSNN
jgi:hypothetical protein